ncbi:MAG: carboxypeptidase-like regulatory domain-containing protein, partial [Bryobacteraceae bacterium]
MPFTRLAAVAIILAGIAQAQPATGALAGRVVLRVSGEPVRKAAVYLRLHGSVPSVALARTDGAGRFVFEGLPAGQYTLRADRQGVGTGEITEFVTLGEGERRVGLTIRVSQLASISGVVFDAEGEPASSANLEILMEFYPRGARQLVPFIRATTNSKGEYQVAGLQPGKYFLLLQGFGQAPGPANQDQVYRSQYYGDTRDWRRATPINLESGQQLRGIDFRAMMTRAVKVSGHVVGAPTPPSPQGQGDAPVQPGPFININLQPVGDDTVGTSNGAGAAPPEYKFEVHQVVPGSYQVRASSQGAEGRTLYARQLVEIGEQPQEIEVVLLPPVDVKGTVRYEGDPARRPPAFQVSLSPGEPIPVQPPALAKVNTDGTFVISGVPPGTWDINPGPIPKGGFLKSMRLGEQDVLTEDMDIGPGTDAPLNIVISSRGGKIAGELETGKPPRGPATIMLAPVGKFAAVMSFFSVVESEADGKFELSGLTPGKYRLFAFDRPPQGDLR